MVDGVTLSAGTADGAKINTDDEGAAGHDQWIKLKYGADGTFTIVEATNGMPIQGDGTDLPITLDGEAVVLGAGTAAYGKLSANSGVDIGDVDVTSVIPLTGATNLGKAIDSAVGGTDTGVAMLAKHAPATARLATAVGDYDAPRLSAYGAVLTEPEQHLVLDNMDALLGFGGTWAAINNDTTGVASSTKHVLGTASVEFDKVDGAVDSGIGGITKALTSVDLSGSSPHDILNMVTYVSSTAALDGGAAYVFLRLGTDSTDYNEWRIDGAFLTAGIWETIAFEVGDASFDGQGGTGIDWSAITYIAAGFFFDAVGDTLANIYIDEISYHTNQHVNAQINAEVTTEINSSNINLHKVANKVTNTQAGASDTGTQRVILATDQNFVHVEDEAFTAADAGVPTLAVRNDDLAALTSADGDYGPLQMTQNGALLMCPAANDDYKYAVINAASTDTTIVAAVTARKIRVLAFTLIAAGTTTCKFQSTTATDLTGTMQLTAQVGMSAGFNPAGHFETVAAELLNLETSGDIDGFLTYIEVP